MQKFFLRALIVLGIGVNVAFLLINLHPERPHVGRRRTVKVLLRADPSRARWVKENLLDEFGAGHDVRFEVVPVHSFEEVLSVLVAERDRPTGLLLAAVDNDIADELQMKKAVRPVESAVELPLLTAAMGEYLPEVAAPSRGQDGKLWFLPKRSEVDIAVYLRPAAEDAYLHWRQDRPAIEAALAEANGVGLPRGYSLKKTPDDWDSYDFFVAAWYWAHHPAPWAARGGNPSLVAPAPRVALRTGPNEDAVNDLLASFYRHGFTDKEVGNPDALPVIDALQWELLLRKHHLLAAPCEDPKGIDSDGVNDLFKVRSLAWAPINQEDSLWLHGGSQRGAPAGMEGAGDLGWATLPSGASLELKAGAPARIGRSYSFTKIQLWAIPVHSPDPVLAFRLARFVTQRGLQQRETEAQGLLPIREDLREQYPIVFRLSWMQHILDASYRQVARGSGAMPGVVAAQELDELYTRLRAAVLGAAATTPATAASVRAAVKGIPHGK